MAATQGIRTSYCIYIVYGTKSHMYVIKTSAKDLNKHHVAIVVSSRMFATLTNARVDLKCSALESIYQYFILEFNSILNIRILL